jgi:outer membrane immunogenic protein
MKITSRLTALLLLAGMAGTAAAQDVIATSSTNWRGFYIGGNLGGAWNSTCSTWQPNNGNGISNPVLASAFYNRDCPNNGSFIGGIQLGYNFQRGPWVSGFGLDYEFLSSTTRNRTFKYAGVNPPPGGTYTFSGKVSPDGFAILGPRIGYAVDQWLPYFRIGGVFASGSREPTATYTNSGGTATFSGSKNFKASGVGVGFGAEYAINDSWSFRADYTYVNLGKSSSSDTVCSGNAAACSAFANVRLDNLHNSFTANVFRVGINYKF